MTSKRIISLLLALTLVCALFAACGSNTADEASAGSEASAEMSAAEAAAEETQIELDEASVEIEEFDLDTGMTAEENEALFPLEEAQTYTIFYPYAPPLIQMGFEDPAELNFFKTLNEMTNVKLDFTVASVETLSEKFNLLVASRDYTDIFSQCIGEYTGGAAAAIEDDVMIDLAPYVDEYAPHYKALMASDDVFKRNNYTDDGYMVQFMSYYENVYVNQGYFYRSDYLEELGMDVPVTYDDWFEFLSACKSQYNMGNPARGVPTSGFQGIAKDGFVIVDGRATLVQGDPDIQKEYLALSQKWFDAGLISAELLMEGYYTDSDLRGMVTKGDLMLTTCDVDQYKVYQEEVPIKAVTYPVKKNGDTPYDVVLQEACGNGNSITSACEDVETLVEYMDYWYSDDVILLANWGTEGETYTVTEDGNYTFTDEVMAFPGGLNLATSVYCAGWEPTVLDFTRKNVAYNDDQLEALDVWNQTDDSQNFPSYASFTSEESEIIKSTYTDIQTYMDENYTMFLIGEKSYESDFDSFVDTLYSMGLQDVIDVYQTVYDRYMAR